MLSTGANVSTAIDPGATILPLQAEKKLPANGQDVAEISGVDDPPLLPAATPLAGQVTEKG